MKHWDTIPEQRKSSLLKEYPDTAKLVCDISSAKSDFAKILATTDPIIRQFVEDFVIPLNAAIKPYAGTPSTLSKVAGAVWDAMCDAPDELGRLLVPGYEAWADGGSGEEIVSSACGDIALTVCGGKVIKVVGKGLNKVRKAITIGKPNKSNIQTATTGIRPTWRQTEQDIGKMLGKDVRYQVKYNRGVETKVNIADTVIPDIVYKGKVAIEAKNWNIAKNSSGMIREIVRQVKERVIHLPKGMKQEVYIDIRGQKVTEATFNKMRQKIVERCNGALNKNDIKWIGDFIG